MRRMARRPLCRDNKEKIAAAMTLEAAPAATHQRRALAAVQAISCRSMIRMDAGARFDHEQPHERGEQAHSDNRDNNVIDHAVKTTAAAQSFISFN